MASRNKVEVILEAFRRDLDPSAWLEFNCAHCKSKVKATPAVQQQLVSGGLGHRCSGCERHYAVVRCGDCREIFVIDDLEWDDLAKAGIDCPVCDVGLFRRSLRGAKVVAGGTMAPSLRCWSEKPEEQAFISEARRRLRAQDQQILAIYHRTTGDRIESARDSLLAISKLDIRASLNLMNVSEPMPSPASSSETATSSVLHRHIFRFANDLRSALDILSQELALITSSNTKEGKVDFNKADRFSRNAFPQLADKIEAFRKSDYFEYLNNLRNALQHRRLPLMQESALYDLDEIEAIRPVSVGAPVTLYLPDNPCEDPLNNNDFSRGRELRDTLGGLLKQTEIFVYEIYAIASESNS